MKTKYLVPSSIIVFELMAFLLKTEAVVPAPDGGYPGGNTAEGQNALLSLSIGGFNTAIGLLSIRSVTTGNFNTAVGAGTLLANTADENTATGGWSTSKQYDRHLQYGRWRVYAFFQYRRLFQYGHRRSSPL